MLPPLPMHGGDRNRTSPFAFTGNKFEFRALGSSMSLALPNTVLNTIVAEAIDDAGDQARGRDGRAARSSRRAILEVVRDVYTDHKRIVFDGDNYAEAWHAEAEERGLANLRTTPDALPWLVEPQTIEVFERYEVLSERELESRYEVFARAVHRPSSTSRRRPPRRSPARCSCPPRCGTSATLDAAGVGRLRAETEALLDELRRRDPRAREANESHPEDGEVLDAAKYMQTTVIPAMDAVREVADRLEQHRRRTTSGRCRSTRRSSSSSSPRPGGPARAGPPPWIRAQQTTTSRNALSAAAPALVFVSTNTASLLPARSAT